MGSKLKLAEPVVGSQIDRARELCSTIQMTIKDFQTEIYYLDSNQLFKEDFVNQLLAIANYLDELNHLILNLIKPKDIYYESLRSALAAINSTSNIFIVTAHYLNPQFEYKRLLNRNTFSLELSLVVKKIDFIRKILERTSAGRPSSRNIPRPVLKFRSR
ncbi:MULTISPECIES: hypothetical protein [Acinetobacter]|uniref:hypothetical protein n=1 Tax=unclassified Acinetobacter TaxID=196816 RepID=UPI001F4F5B08|nr:hypothetical protein [Acinetobacter sp. A7.4]MCJ8162332.1 hypothetical protein [Acinetobacter sp. A7.4]